MLWQVIIPREGEDELSVSLTVEADNWYSALKNGLDKQGVFGTQLSNLSCNIMPDETVMITDFVTRRIFTLRPVYHDDKQKSTDTAGAESLRDAPPKVTGDYRKHKIFFWRDEEPDDGSNIYYRERLLSVMPGCSREETSRLVHAYYEQLKAMGSTEGTKLFITVQIFDHEFKEQSQRPAVAALTWREWNPKKPKILFPLSGAAGVTFSKLPPPPLAAIGTANKQPEYAKPAPTPIAEEVPLPLTRLSEPSKESTPKEKPPEDKDKKAAVPTPEEKPPRVEKKYKNAGEEKKKKTRRKISSLTPPPKEFTVDDKVITAFERMQEIYSVRDHDDAAEFTLALARELIDCEAGSCMLMTPGKFELYVSAAEGPVADSIKGVKCSLAKGIVGFSTRTSTVVNVADPVNDSRFDKDLDEKSGFKTMHVLCAPVQHEGFTIGAIELLNSKRITGFTQGEANVLSYLGSALAEYINNSLPSREADFSNREFLDPATANKVKTGIKKSATKTTKKSGADKSYKTVAKRSPQKKAKAGEAISSTSGKGSKVKKKKKKKKKKK